MTAPWSASRSGAGAGGGDGVQAMNLFRWLGALGASFAVTLSSPAGVAKAAGAEPAAAPTEATLQFFNRDVITFRAPMLGVSAPDRARRARTRVDEQLAAPGAHKVALQPNVLGTLVQIDGATTFIVTAADADTLAQEPLDVAAGKAAAALELAISETRESRDLDAVARGVTRAAGATVALAVALWLMWRAQRAVERWLIEVTGAHTGRLRLGGVELVQRERVAWLVHALVVALRWLVTLLIVYEWFSLVFGQFPYTRPWAEQLNGFLFGVVARVGGAMLRAVPGLIVAGVIFVLARFASRMLGGFFDRVQAGQLQLSWLDADVAVPTRRLAAAAVWLFALAMAYPYLPGSQTEAFKGVSVLVGLMISLGASNLVGQAASGLILTYGRVYRRGEYVRIAEHEGTVIELGMFTTRIRTGLGEELTLSNSLVVGAVTKNYSRAVKGPGYVLDTAVTIGYDTPWRQVHAMLVEAALNTPGVLAEPPPQVFQTALSDFYPEYRLVCQAIPSEPRPRALLLSALHASIQDVFNEYGVQIMSPQYYEDPPVPKTVPKEHWYTAPARPPEG